MGILKQHKIIFCHIPKTGGITTHKIMESIGNLEICDRHYNLLQLKEKIDDDELFEKSLKFCIVRNPWDRMVSTYFFRKEKKEEDFGPIEQWDLDFNDWISYIYSPEYKNLKLKHTGTCDNVLYQFGSSIRWVLDENNNILADKIIRFENLNEELKTLFSNYNYTQEITKNNSTKHRRYQEYYNENSKNLVAQNFKEDIEYFNYKFE